MVCLNLINLMYLHDLYFVFSYITINHHLYITFHFFKNVLFLIIILAMFTIVKCKNNVLEKVYFHDCF